MIKSRRMRWMGGCSTYGRDEKYIILSGKLKGKRPFGRPRFRREDDIRMDCREIEWKGLDWMHLAQNRDQGRALVDTVMNLWVP
jgi:hypothetical protein